MSSKRTGLVVSVLVVFMVLTGWVATVQAAEAPAKVVMEQAFKLEIPFVVNEGQIPDGKVSFYAKTFGGTIYVTQEGEMIYALSGGEGQGAPRRQEVGAIHELPLRGPVKRDVEKSAQLVTLKEKLVGVVLKPAPKGTDRAETKVNYFLGNDKSKWRSNLATYNTVSLGEVYKGVELALRAYGKQVEKIFTVRPGADSSAISLKLEGAKSLKVNPQGELEVETGQGTVRFSKPIAYQSNAEFGMRNAEWKNQNPPSKIPHSALRTPHSEVQVAYQIINQNTYSFKVGAYDKTRPLIIDPVLAYSTYLGGSDNHDWGFGMAVDSAGCAYIIGGTSSADFPTASPLYESNKGGWDIFVTKFNAAGSALVYSTYLGGTGNDWGYGIAVDSTGSIYITGQTNSINFPTASALYGNLKGGNDAFITKLNAAGILVYSTYLGGTGLECGNGIAVDSTGCAYVTGYTTSINDFPTTASPLQGSNAGGNDAFVTKLNAAGDALVYSTYLGGTGDDYGYGIAVDRTGCAYITGNTYDDTTDFPTTASAYQVNNAGSSDAFVTKLNAAGSALVYSTFLGGSSADEGHGIAVDSAGCAYVTGCTTSPNFPIASAIYPGPALGWDAFVTKLDAAGSALVYSTYLGGNVNDQGYGIAVDSAGCAYITGWTNSSDFPTFSALQGSKAGGNDAFVTKLNAAGDALVYSTYLGGNSNDWGYGIAVDSAGSAYITGWTDSTNFPTASAFQGSKAGFNDVFVTKISSYSCLVNYLGVAGVDIYTKSSTVTLDYDYVGSPTMIRTSTGTSWTTWIAIPAPGTHTISLGSTNGIREIYTQVKDALGNISPVARTTIILDTTAPTGAIQINNGASSVQRTGNATVVTLTIVANDTASGIDKMAIYQTGDVLPTVPPDDAFVDFAPTYQYLLNTAATGTKTVYVWLKDNAGKISYKKSDGISVTGP